MKKIKKLLAIILSVSLAIGVAGCGQSSNNEGSTEAVIGKKVLRFAEANPKNSLDMQTNTNSKVAVISDHVTEALLRYDEDHNLVPILIKDMPTVSEDGLVYSFELKEGVKFHNGETLKSSDVKFTLERMFTPATGALSTYNYDMIKGAKEMLSGAATTLEGFKVIDDSKFEITLIQPYAPFISNLAISYAHIFPEVATKEAGQNWGITTLIGTGPYKLQENNQDTGVTLVKNEEYHGGAPKLDEIQIKYIDDPNTQLLEYEKGNIDVVALDATLYKNYSENEEFKDEIRDYKPLSITFLNTNNADKILGNKKVREALSYAINRDEIANYLLNGTVTPAKAFLNPAVPGFNEDAKDYEYSVEKAKALLAEAGYANGVQIKATVSSADGNASRVLTAIQAQAKDAGFDIQIESMDAATFNQKKKDGELQLYMTGWAGLYADGDHHMYSYLYSESSKTKSLNYNNPEFDELMLKARVSTDEAERAELYKKADEIATRQDFAVIPLYNQTSYYLSKPYVENMKIGNLIYHFFGVDINTELLNKK